VTIADNGKGMHQEHFRYALTLAKELKVGIDQLGKYGMGMKTAALSMTTQIDIFTKTINGPILFGEFNINKMENLGAFKTEVREATKEEVDFFKQKTSDSRSGTVIVLKNCDRIEILAETFIHQLREYIGMTYRSYMSRGITFTVSNTFKKGEVVKKIDPLMREYSETTIICNRETFPIEYHENNKTKTSFIEVTAVVLPKALKQGKFVNGNEIPLTINQANQGIYVLREGREVGKALTWANVWGERHPSKNRFRVEIIVKSDLDDEIRMNFQKGNVSPTAFLKNQLASILKQPLNNMREVAEPVVTPYPTRKPVSPVTPTGTRNPSPVVPFVAPSATKPVSIPTEPAQTIGTVSAPSPLPEISSNVLHDELISAANKIKLALENKFIPDDIKNEIREILGMEKTQ
jgi:hypothetical protein